MGANDNQVGGNHYKAKLQHWDFIHYLNLSYFPAQITRYVSRWKKKNGLEDLEKAHHYTCKFIEVEHRRHEANLILLENFIKENNLGEEEKRIFNMLVNYHLGDGDRLLVVRDEIEKMIDILKGKPQNPKDVGLFRVDSDEWRK